MGKLLLYFISLLIFSAGFFRIQKSEQRLSGILFLGITILSYMLVNTVLAGIYGLIGVPICVYTISLPVMILGGILLAYSKKHVQEYVFSKNDKIVLCFLVVLTLCFWVGYFRCKLPIRYVSVDASVHCRWAKQIALQHTLNSNLFFGYVNDGLFMEALLTITGINGFYHSFAFMRIVDFFLAGLLFYSLIRDLCVTRYQKIAGIVVTTFYIFGYPLYALMFGFVYFGDAVTIICLILLLLKMYETAELKHQWILIMMNLSLFGIFTTYTMFVPGVFLGVFIDVLVVQKKFGNKIISKESIVELFKVFIFPCVLGMTHAYVNLKEISSGGGISNDGGKYFDLYSNFVLLAPFVLSSLIKRCKRHQFDGVFWMFVTTIAFTGLFLAGSWIGVVSTYYLSKMYNIIWLLCFIMMMEEIVELSRYNKEFMNAFAACIFVLSVFVIVDDVDQKFSGNQEIKTGANCFLNIYWFNGNFFLNQPFIDNDEIVLYQECHDITENLADGEMLYVGDEIHANWFKTFTNQTEIEISGNSSIIQSRIIDGSYKYICVNSELSEEEISELYEFGNIIYEYNNELSSGKVIEVY